MGAENEEINTNHIVQELAGKWKIDLSTSPDADTEFQVFEVQRVAGKTFQGIFSGSEVHNGLINSNWSRPLYIAFMTSDQSDQYYHSGSISNGLIKGITCCPDRNLILPWSGRNFFRHENNDWEETHPSLNEEQHSLIEQIKTAFKGVKLDHGVSLHGTIVIDAFGFEEDIRRWYDWDESEDWTKLIYDPELRAVSGIGGLSFYDIRGMMFHLPAYLCAAILWPYENIAFDLVSQLTNMSDYNLKKFRVLNSAQKKAVESFLYYIISIPEGYYNRDHAKIHLAIEQFWYTQD